MIHEIQTEPNCKEKLQTAQKKRKTVNILKQTFAQLFFSLNMTTLVATETRLGISCYYQQYNSTSVCMSHVTSTVCIVHKT